MRISWLSNFFTVNVGYGQIVRNLLPAINEKHPSCLITNYGLQEGNRIDNFWKGITCYGAGHGGFDESLVPNHVKNFKADCLISIYDIWALDKLHVELANNKIPFIPYVPIDSEDVNPRYLKCLPYAFKIIPMSKYSEKCLKKYFPDKTLSAITPGVDLNIFKPLWDTTKEKNKLKKNLGFSEDTFVIGLMGDIKGLRLRWPENLEGIKIFKERNPNIKIGVYIHANLRIAQSVGFDVTTLIQLLGLQDITRAVDPYKYVVGVNDEEMAKTYNTIDVLLQCAYGHGFGMMMAEAAACGTPSVTSDFTSMPEVCDDTRTGYLVKPAFIEYDQSLGKKFIPDPEDIADKLEMVYKKGSASFRKDCVQFAQQYSWENINNQWLETLKQLEQDVYWACFNPPEASEELKTKSEKITIHAYD